MGLYSELCYYEIDNEPARHIENKDGLELYYNNIIYKNKITIEELLILFPNSSPNMSSRVQLERTSSMELKPNTFIEKQYKILF